MTKRVYEVILVNGSLAVPRDEFYCALRHFANQRLVKELTDMYQRMEKEGYRCFRLTLNKTGLQQYTEAMYKQGRALPQGSIDEKRSQLQRAAGLLSGLMPRPFTRLAKEYKND